MEHRFASMMSDHLHRKEDKYREYSRQEDQMRQPSIDIPPERERSYDSEEEDPRDIGKPGGYCRVTVGERFKGGRYTALKKLGWGHFSTVWLCYDWVHKCVVGIKLQKSAPNYADAAKDEILVLRDMKKRGARDWPVVQLLDHFDHYGSNGKHVCLVFEVLGKSLLSLIHRFNEKGLPLELVRRIGRHVMEGLMFLHIECRIIHTDIKPENVLVVPMDDDFLVLNDRAEKLAHHLNRQRALDPSATASKGLTKNQKKRLKEKRKRALELQELDQGSNEYSDELSEEKSLLMLIDSDRAYSRGEVKIIDMGNALWRDDHNAPEIQTRQYRCPEVILGADYGSSADIWSAACLFFELATGEYLFEPRKCRNYEQDEDHLALMMECLGPIPKPIAMRGRRSREFFNRYGQLRNIRRLRLFPLDSILIEEYSFSPADAKLFSSFLLPMLRFDPSRRATAQECLSHPFLSEEKRR